MDPYYWDLLDNYEDEEDMCNQLGLNYDDIYIYPGDPDYDEHFFDDDD
ncbi:MAG: hypothetical protein ACTTJJ_08860 [Prevotella fusca]